MPKKKTKKITIVYSEDWEGIYVDNNLLTQGELLTSAEVLTILQEQGIISFSEIKIEDYYLYDELGGKLPDTLSSCNLDGVQA